MNSVMARELGSNLEASIQVRKEAEENRLHWHRLYERCWCGYLTVPVKYYEYDAKGRQTNTQAQAEAAFLAAGGVDRDTEMVQRYGDVPTEVVPTPDVPTCEDCGERPREGRYKLCSVCRKKVYRERSK